MIRSSLVLVLVVTGVSEEEARLELIKATVAMLPPANKALLTRLVALMRLVADHAEVNKMHAQNLAIVFAPCLMRPPDDNIMVAILDGGVSQNLLATMIQHHSFLFVTQDKGNNQFVKQYREFYKTLKKGTLCLEASIVEEKKLLEQLKESTTKEQDDGEEMFMSAEILQFAEKAKNRRRPKIQQLLSNATPSTSTSQSDIESQPEEKPSKEHPESGKEESGEGTGATSVPPKLRKEQIYLSWHPSQTRRDLGATGKGSENEQHADREGSLAKELARSQSAHVMSIRNRLKVSSELSSDEDEDEDPIVTAPGHKPRKMLQEEEDSESEEESESEGSHEEPEETVSSPKQLTYLTPEQMVRLVRQKRAEKRKEMKMLKEKKVANVNDSSESASTTEDEEDEDDEKEEPKAKSENRASSAKSSATSRSELAELAKGVDATKLAHYQ